MKACKIIILFTVVIFSTVARGEITYWYPDTGRATYNGDMKITIDMGWTSRPLKAFWDNIDRYPAGFEIDAVIRKSFLNRCTSLSTFLDKYDDCPTAGVIENESQWSFGCGTFDGAQFSQEATGGNFSTLYHTCEINFSRNYHRPATSSDLGINASIVTRQICSFKSIWCYFSKKDESKGIKIERLNSPKNNRFIIRRGQAFSGVWGNFVPLSNSELAEIQQQSNFSLAQRKQLSTLNQSEVIVPLSVGAINQGAFGKDYGTNQHPTQVQAQFYVNKHLGKFYYLNVNGYDIDTSNEISVIINGVNYGNLKQSSNNSMNAGDFFAINQNHIRLGTNTIIFRNNRGDKYGITNIDLSTSNTPPPPVVNLVVGEKHNGSYGRNFGTNQHRNRLITTFDNTNKNIAFKVSGYNIVGGTQTRVFLNDTLLGYLSVGGSGRLNQSNTFSLKSSQLLEGQNSIEFVNVSGSTWGVTNLELKRSISIAPIISLLLDDD